MAETIERYLKPAEAQQFLASMNVELNDRQMRRAMEPDANGRRKLPFFKDPATGRLQIAESKLREIYSNAQAAAEKNALRRDK